MQRQHISASLDDAITLLKPYCLKGVDYDQRSAYQSNLNLLLSNFSTAAANTRFYNATVGGGSSKVYGLFLCNGVYTNQVCHDCITIGAGQIQQNCPTSMEAIIWYGQCMIRYANHSIFSIADDSVHSEFEYGPTDFKQFNEQLSSSMIDLISNAVADNSSLTFATEVVDVSESSSLMGYVDCTPDLTPSDCHKCLQIGLHRLPMHGRPLGTLLQPSCRLAYYFTGVKTGKGFSSIKIALIATVVLAATLLLSNIYMYKRKSKEKGKPTGIDEIESLEILHLDFDSIKTATDNFSDTNKIGQGGFGVVYMTVTGIACEMTYQGVLSDGQAIAVKRLTSSSGQGMREFKSEASLAAKLQHRNLVKLFGFCTEKDEKLLVYEFLPNKSLDRFLFDTKRGVYLSWDTRHKIIIGIARGLLYLHEDSRFKIVHRDLKPGNILLDGEMSPKIADFGMAKLFGVDQTQGNTSRIAGTFGYMAPEYAITGHFSAKSDVFGFGVILLEIMSRRRNNVSHPQEDDENLLPQAWRLWNEGASLRLLDPHIRESCSINEVTRCIHIGLLCTQEDAAQRPTISSVMAMLILQSVSLPIPTAPPASSYQRHASNVWNQSNVPNTEEIFTNVQGR